MKLALITGGSKGLGAALVERYTLAGWQVREYSRSGVGAHHIDCDFAEQAQSTAILAQTFAELATHAWTQIVLINNVGTLDPMGPIELSEARAWQTHLQINLSACVTATGLFLQHFGSTSAQRLIVNISSGAATSAYHGWSLYCTSKAAIEAFTRCVALDQAESDHPTTVIAIRPGVIDTDMQGAIRAQDQAHFKEREKFSQLKADGHLLSPQASAEKVLAVIASKPKSGETVDVRDL